MRARMRGSGVTASTIAMPTAVEMTKWVQAPREKLNRSPPKRIISTATSRSLMPRTSWLTRSQTIGKIRNGP